MTKNYSDKQVNCVICKKSFVVKSRRAKYCSSHCMWEGIKLKHGIENIKKKRAENYLKNRDIERKRCQSWYQRHRESEIKKNQEYRKQKRELFDWYHNRDRFGGIRKSVLERDRNKCKLCGSEKVIVHHIDGTGWSSVNSTKSLNNDLKNLIVLCSPCHSAIHHWQRQNRKLVSREDIVRTLGKPRERQHYGVIRKTFIYGK